jgi:UDP-glucose 4-epimerase
MNGVSPNSLAAYREVNVEGPVNLNCTAAASRVKRFNYHSSIKVNGQAVPPGTAYNADDVPALIDTYGFQSLKQSKDCKRLA